MPPLAPPPRVCGEVYLTLPTLPRGARRNDTPARSARLRASDSSDAQQLQNEFFPTLHVLGAAKAARPAARPLHESLDQHGRACGCLLDDDVDICQNGKELNICSSEAPSTSGASKCRRFFLLSLPSLLIGNNKGHSTHTHTHRTAPCTPRPPPPPPRLGWKETRRWNSPRKKERNKENRQPKRGMGEEDRVRSTNKYQ